jgi:hypothetical protein
MPKVSPILANFTAGELSPLLEGRVDISKYFNGAKTIENFIVTPYGGLEATVGSKFAAEVKDSSKSTRLVAFQFSTEQAYILEFGDQYIRFYKDNGSIVEVDRPITGATQADPVVITAVAHGFANGQEITISGVVGMTELNGKRFIVANQTANTFELTDKDGVDVDGTGFTAYVSGGVANRILEISSPYLEAELFDLQFAQSFDTLYIAHNNGIAKIARITDVLWTLSTGFIKNGPYLPTNDSAVTITPSADIGTGITLTSSATIFQSGHVGSSWRIKDGWVKIATFISTTQVTANVQEGGDLNTGPGATTDWAEGAWSDVRGFPACLTFHEQRLVYASSIDNPQTFWGSVNQNFERMDAGVADDDAFIFTIFSEQVDVIRWLSSGDVLSVGTVGGVYSARGTANAPITPTNIDVKRDTTYGSAFTLPKKIGSFVYYLQRDLKTLRELSFNFDIDGRIANDMTVLAEHITGVNGIIEMDYQQAPRNVLWCIRADGEIATLTRQIEQQVIGWSRQKTDGLYESVAVIPQATYDEVWTIVNRTINGVTRRYVEYYVAPTVTEQEDLFYLHSGLSLDNPLPITGATQAEPVVITSTAHGLSNGDEVVIRNVLGMTELNKRKFKVANKTANTFEITDKDDNDIDGTGFGAYTSGGEARQAFATVTNLDHLEGKTVDILADGSVQPSEVVSNGAITLDNTFGEIHVGLPYIPKLLTLRPEFGSATGTAQGKIKRIYEAVVRINESLGFKIGNEDIQDIVPFRNTNNNMNEPPPLFTGDKTVAFAAGYSKDSLVQITQEQPLPLNIIAIMLRMDTFDR